MIAEHQLGLDAAATWPESKRRLYINLKLSLLGLPAAAPADHSEIEEMLAAVLPRHQEASRLLADYLSPVDQRLQDFLDDYFQNAGGAPRLPRRTFVLDRYGLARTLSLPPDADEFVSEYARSYRCRQGVLHNPKADRRTTAGIFHIAEGGLPVPDDKLAVPVATAAALFRQALEPPREVLRLPFTSTRPEPAECFVSLLLRPRVCPSVPGFLAEKTMEIRFFAPGNLVSNLDFVESIFGNAGDPFLPENDAALDADHWTGHTGGVILAPHLTRLTKREVGLPAWDAATDRQRRDGMCWKQPDELYNDGRAFKVAVRDARGVMVTVIADNYFGYCKKEVKTQISFSANLFGMCEEEHAGGALVCPSYDLGEELSGDRHMPQLKYTWATNQRLFGQLMELQPEGYGVDKRYPEIVYVPETAHFDLLAQTVSWPGGAGRQSIRLLPDKTYVRPSGYRVRMEKPAGSRTWRLVGTLAEPTLCHKPCTVSGGGKSEISKPISDAIIQGPVFVADFDREFDWVGEILRRDFGDRFQRPAIPGKPSRPILSAERSLGSVIKLLTPSPEYTDAYNAWLATIPQSIKELVYVVKRCYKPEMGAEWRAAFSVDIINGRPGNELKFQNRKLTAYYLRVGYDRQGAWRTFGLRQDYVPADKQQVEDDITASVVVPAAGVPGLNPEYTAPSVKFVQNCEYRLFQRPDDAIHPGYDKVTEAEFAQPGNFFSNYEPLPVAQARALIEDAITFDKFTPPMQAVLRDFVREGTPRYVVCNTAPRLVDGKPSKNPRYLQTRPDLLNARGAYLLEIGVRFWRQIPLDQPVPLPVNAVLPGRRNNPPEGTIRPLAVFNPIHYLELPELFMEFICSMTGKSPSTTGAGSEGALTKGPFNALPPIMDLNNALVAAVLTRAEVFLTAAGYVGPHCRVDHDVSLLVPEIWSRMTVAERDPHWLIAHGYLERCRDFGAGAARVLASRLGYRITAQFVSHFFGRVFNHPHLVFTDEMLRPETQDPAIFADGMANMVETHRRVAQAYFDDGSLAGACPPLRALLHIMRDGTWEGRTLEDPAVRGLFTRENVLASDWYAQRLDAQQAGKVRLWERHVRALESFLSRNGYVQEAHRLGIHSRLDQARRHLETVRSAAYRQRLVGALGVHPL
jgi:hypothetical protein